MSHDKNFTVAIVLELENAALGESSRVGRMLKETVAQIAQLSSLSETDEGVQELPYLLNYKGPLELVVTYNESLESNEIIRSLSNFIGAHNPMIKVILLPSPALKYFDLKNYGAERTTSDIIVFLDCDVIPQQDWLINLISSFANADLGVVGSNTYIQHSTIYQKGYALIKFEFPSDSNELVPSYDIPHGNSIAFRRSTFEKYPFPPTGSSYKLAFRYLVNNLRAGGEQLYANLGAQVEHPAPLPGNILIRGFFHGRDEMMLRQDNKKNRDGKAEAYHSNHTFFGLNELRLAYQRLLRIFKNYKKVQVTMLELPFAMLIVFLYYSAVAAGYFVTMLFPNILRGDKFDYLVMAE